MYDLHVDAGVDCAYDRLCTYLMSERGTSDGQGRDSSYRTD